MNKKFNSVLSAFLAILMIVSSALCGFAVNADKDNDDAADITSVTVTDETTTIVEDAEVTESTSEQPSETTEPVSEEDTTVPEETTTEPVFEEETTTPEETTTEPVSEEEPTVPEETTTEPVSEEDTTVPEKTTTVPEETTTEPVSEEETTIPEETTTEPKQQCPPYNHRYVSKIDRATREKDGYVFTSCEVCDYVLEDRIIERVADIVAVSDGEELKDNSIVFDGDYHYVKVRVIDSLNNELSEYNQYTIKGNNSTKKIGTYKFTVTFNKTYYDIVETVIYKIVAPVIDEPLSLSAKSTKTGVKVTWKKSDNADGYNLYRKDSVSSSWKKIKKTTETEFTDTNVEYNKEYTYAVRAYDIIGSETFNSNYNKQGVKVKTSYVLTPQQPSVKMTNDGVQISWSKIPGATKYYIYRATSKAGTYSKLGSVNSTTTKFTDKKATLGKTYYYKVKAYTGSKASSASAYSGVKANLPAPTINKKITATSTSFTFSWQKLTKADGYFIYKLDGKTYTKVADVKKSQTEYTYKSKKLVKLAVAAYYKNSSGSKVKSAYSGTIYASAVAKPELDLKASPYNREIYVNSSVKTNSYQIYYKLGKSGSWKLLEKGSQYGNHNTLSTSHSVKLNKAYYYKIRAIEIKASNVIYGAFSDIKQLTLGYIPNVTVTLPKKNYNPGNGFDISIKNGSKKTIRVYGAGSISNNDIASSGDLFAMSNYIDIKSGKTTKITFLPTQVPSPIFDTKMPAYLTSSKVILYFKYDGIEYASLYNCKTGKIYEKL